jgi:hypothetical protein
MSIIRLRCKGLPEVEEKTWSFQMRSSMKKSIVRNRGGRSGQFEAFIFPLASKLARGLPAKNGAKLGRGECMPRGYWRTL